VFINLHQLLSGTNTQASRKDFNRFGGTVGRRERHCAFDAGFDPDDTTQFEVALVRNSDER
jgi:hypothetical protein